MSHTGWLWVICAAAGGHMRHPVFTVAHRPTGVPKVTLSHWSEETCLLTQRCLCASLTFCPYFSLMFINHSVKIKLLFYGLFELKRLAARREFELALAIRFIPFFSPGNKNPRKPFHSRVELHHKRS